MAKFKYVGTAPINQNCTHEEIKSRLNSGNVCYHSVLILSSPRLLLKNTKITILPVVFKGIKFVPHNKRRMHFESSSEYGAGKYI